MRHENLKRFRAILLAGIVLPACAGQALDQAGIVWSEFKNQEAQFLPERLINSTPPESWPVSRYCRQDLSSEGRRVTPSPRTLATLFPEPTGPGPNAVPLGERLDDSSEIVIGVVSAIEPGWSCYRSSVAFRVDVLVDQTLKGCVSPGSTVSVVELGGSLELFGAKVDWGYSKLQPKLSVGNAVLISGRAESECSTGILEEHTRFRIVDQKVQHVPYGSLQPSGADSSLANIVHWFQSRKPV